jgi:hypothetical protein
MLVIIYGTLNVPDKREFWTISDKQFPTHIEPDSVTQIFSTSIESSYIKDNVDVNRAYDEWEGDEAKFLFSKLKENFDKVF